jgi:GNAT superfamily N-acetyltransferase
MSTINGLAVRRATAVDLPAVLALARRALGWTDDDTKFLEWKHVENAFGASPMWIASDDDRVVGFRAFMRWEFVTPDGDRIRAARAVDTATDPEYQGRGIFTRLTQSAVEQLPAEGVQLIFNTPNERSLPGYLKMGWRQVGRLGVAVNPTGARFPLVVMTARGAASRLPVRTTVGLPASEALQPSEPVAALLDAVAPAAGLTTRRTPEFLRWRYGHPPLGYRVLLQRSSPEQGVAVFRRRRRGSALEAVLCELLVPAGADAAATESELISSVGREAGADYVLRLDRRALSRGPFVRLPHMGPVLVCRRLDGAPPPELRSWALTMGDIELF